MNKNQYTIRQIPEKVDEALRYKAKIEGRSLNEVVVEALTHGIGLSETKTEFHDLDHLAGTWKEDPKFDEAIRDQDQIDPDIWK